MPSFAITPTSGFPPAASSDFPNFIQWQDTGVNLGGPTVDTVNLIGNVHATRGTGENANKLTIFVVAPLVWAESYSDFRLTLEQAENGVAMLAVSGAVNVVIPANSNVDFPIGTSILVYAAGGADVHILADSGIALRLRAGLNPQLAGQYAIATLIQRAIDEWIVCGDLLVT
jgi:hypothetical protein